MTKKAVVWFRDDLRINDNPALSNASNNHEVVSALYIFNENEFSNKREAQKWWVYKSLENLKSELKKYNINLEILNGDEFKILANIKTKDDISIYSNKVYEPAQIDTELKLAKYFNKNEINFTLFKGNILIEYHEVLKDDGTPFKVFTPFWKNAEQRYLEKLPSKPTNIKKLKKSDLLFKSTFKIDQILPKKNWYKKFEKYWKPSELEALKFSKEFIINKISKYGDTRDFPNIEGTSKISPFLKHGQISVETIWRQCSEIKNKDKGYR